jgi:hypothetical protein
MDQIWLRIIEGASQAEAILVGILIYLWLSHRDLVNDLRAEVKRRRITEDDGQDERRKRDKG